MELSSNPEELGTLVPLNPDTQPYPDSVEGKLQYMTDVSLYYGAEMKLATSSFKREFYKKKLEKNNQKLTKLLLRTPNAFNPLMKYMQQAVDTAKAIEGEALPEDGVLVPFCQTDEYTGNVEYTISVSPEHTEQAAVIYPPEQNSRRKLGPDGVFLPDGDE